MTTRAWTPISDPTVMRALAHPARMAIMEYLTSTGTAVTATECANVVALSPSAISYHLRALARYGLVEEAPSRGDARERLWRSAVQSLSFDVGQHAGPEARAAEHTLVENLVARQAQRVQDWLRQAPNEPREWYDAAWQSRSVLLLTAEELAELNEAVMRLFRPYLRRNRTEPPDGARVVSAYYLALPMD